MSRMLKSFGTLLVTVSLSIVLALGFANPAFAAPYCDRSSGPEPDCASVICVTNPEPDDVIKVNETFKVDGYIIPSRCPEEYSTPNYVQLCFPYGGPSNCDPIMKEVDPNTLAWESTQVLSDPGDREIISTGFYGTDRVTQQNRMSIIVAR